MFRTTFHTACGALGTALALGAAGAVPSHAQPGDVIFSEVMWAGSAASSADEWIELYNRGLAPVDLAGWTITRGDGDEEQVMVLIESGVLAPGAVYLIANYDDADQRSHLAAAPDLVEAAVSLPNSRLRLRLYDGDPGSGRLVDLADDGSGAPFAGLGGDSPAAMVRVGLDLPGDRAEAWATATAAAGWDPGAAELGTPGSMAGGSPAVQSGDTSVGAASWAWLKMAHR